MRDCCSTLEAPENTCLLDRGAICTSTKQGRGIPKSFEKIEDIRNMKEELELVLTSQALLLLRRPSQDFVMMSVKGILTPNWCGRGRLFDKGRKERIWAETTNI
jgi:hypothetical protein